MKEAGGCLCWPRPERARRRKDGEECKRRRVTNRPPERPQTTASWRRRPAIIPAQLPDIVTHGVLALEPALLGRRPRHLHRRTLYSTLVPWVRRRTAPVLATSPPHGMHRSQPLLDTHPEFTILDRQGSREFRVENWRLARDGSKRRLKFYGWTWLDGAFPIVLAVLWPSVRPRFFGLCCSKADKMFIPCIRLL